MMYEGMGFHGSYSYGRRAPNAEGPANLIPDIKKLEQATGWQPFVSFAEGIRRIQKY
jgi:nucleoside-diphosphate-sugar epimerase